MNNSAANGPDHGTPRIISAAIRPISSLVITPHEFPPTATPTRSSMDLAKIGEFARAEKLAKGLYQKCPCEGVPAMCNLLVVLTCKALQMGSYIHLQQLELEEAMTLQVEAAALPGSPEKAICLAGTFLGEQGINLKTPLKDQIQEAIDNPEVFARRKAKLEITKQISGKLWKEVERRR